MKRIRNMGRNFDGKKLDELLLHLNGQHHLQAIREPILENSRFSTRNCIRNPDFQITIGEFTCYAELDGYKIHGSLDEPSERTVIRNSDYERTNTPYILLNEEDAKLNNLDRCDLLTYLASYEHSKFLARRYL